MSNKAVVVLSGGLDSTTLAYDVKDRGYDVYGISFDYGQRHRKELEFATQTMARIGQDHEVANMRWLSQLFKESGSSLVTDVDVPEGHYGEESMKSTVVPNRNMIMLSIAAGYALSIGATGVWTGVHAGDHFIYPDCRPRFVYLANAAIVLGNEGFGTIHDQQDVSWPQKFIHAPYIDSSKNWIAHQAVALDVPIQLTWSCYKGGKKHCGKCGTCVERIEALNSAVVKNDFPNFVDPTEYEDSTFWKTALARETV